MNNYEARSIVIIGGGASATLLVHQLVKQSEKKSNAPLNIYVIDKSNTFNVGLAYAISHPSFILNVPANKMGVDQDEPEGFYKWLCDFPLLWRKLKPDFENTLYEASDFVPRMIYAEYLRWTNSEANLLARHKNIKVLNISEEVIKVNENNSNKGLEVITQSGQIFLASTVIFSTGNQSPNYQCPITDVISSPYTTEFFDQDWANIKNITILGSGLSMVDVVQYLGHENYSGNIHIISRHGLIPLPHTSLPLQQLSFSLNRLDSALTIIRKIRNNITLNSENNIPWQATINSLRTYSNQIWLSLKNNERRKLVRALPWWNIARHRIPQEAHIYLRNLQENGRLKITKGNIKEINRKNDHFVLNLNGEKILEKSEKMIVCNGYINGYKQLHLLCDKLLSDESLNQLFKETQLDFKISSTHQIFALGPALRGILFETTAIQEIRQQSALIASAILKCYK